jgi:hypothetical protein
MEIYDELVSPVLRYEEVLCQGDGSFMTNGSLL